MQHKLHEIFNIQLQQQRLVILSDSRLLNMRLQQEKQALQRLQQQSTDYLNQYDQLFRLLSLMLLSQKFDLTNHQPHQVLKNTLEHLFPNIDVYRVVQQRHRLKKRLTTKQDAVAQQDLDFMLNKLESFLQAYEI